MAPGDGPLKLVIFDVDGTLIDSQALILAAMARMCRAAGRPVLPAAEVLSIVGLSLPQAMAVLFPEETPAEHHRLADHYKSSFVEIRAEAGGEAAAPLYPGAREALEALDAAGILMSIATGKARRGLDHMFAAHGLGHFFLAPQTADDAPSKPHPQMVLNCLAGTGVEAAHAVVLGDTSYDMEMARAAGCHALGVAWGYHPVADLHRAGAAEILENFDDLMPALGRIWGP